MKLTLISMIAIALSITATIGCAGVPQVNDMPAGVTEICDSTHTSCKRITIEDIEPPSVPIVDATRIELKGENRIRFSNSSKLDSESVTENKDGTYNVTFPPDYQVYFYFECKDRYGLAHRGYEVPKFDIVEKSNQVGVFSIQLDDPTDNSCTLKVSDRKLR